MRRIQEVVRDERQMLYIEHAVLHLHSHFLYIALSLALLHTHTYTYTLPFTPTYTHVYATGMPMRYKESEHEAMQQFDCSGSLPRQNPNATATAYLLALQMA